MLRGYKLLVAPNPSLFNAFQFHVLPLLGGYIRLFWPGIIFLFIRRTLTLGCSISLIDIMVPVTVRPPVRRSPLGCPAPA